jgi:hypothetical protein
MDSSFFWDTCIIGARLKKVLYVGILLSIIRISDWFTLLKR